MSAFTKTDDGSQHDNNMAFGKETGNQPQNFQSEITKWDEVKSKQHAFSLNSILILPQMAKKVKGLDGANDTNKVDEKSAKIAKESLVTEKQMTGCNIESNVSFNTHTTRDSLSSTKSHDKRYSYQRKSVFTESTPQPRRKSNELPVHSKNEQKQFCTPLKSDNHLNKTQKKDFESKTNLPFNKYNNTTKPSQANIFSKHLNYNDNLSIRIPTSPKFAPVTSQKSYTKEVNINVADTMTLKLESDEVLSLKSDASKIPFSNHHFQKKNYDVKSMSMYLDSSIEGIKIQSPPIHQNDKQISVKINQNSKTLLEHKNIPSDENLLSTDEKLSDDKEFSSPSPFPQSLITKSYNTFDSHKMLQNKTKDTQYLVKHDNKATQKRKKNTPTKAKTKRRRKNKAESPINVKLPMKSDGDTINGAEIMMSLVTKQDEKNLTEKATENIPITNDRNFTEFHEICNPPRQLNSNSRCSTANYNNKKDNDILSKLPKLPVEPEYNEIFNTDFVMNASVLRANENGQSMLVCRQDSIRSPLELPAKVYGPTIGYIHQPSSTTQSNKTKDSWWPHYESSKNTEKQNLLETNYDENKRQVNKNDKRQKSKEPLVLHKIPHCKKYFMKQSSKDAASNIEPMFCFQVTEFFPNDMMVCCSICFTWRHVCCGGHHCISGIKLAKLNKPFIPICDFCFKEKKRYSENTKINKSLNQRRKAHLRRTLISHKIMRNASNLKQKTSNWPLGSVKAENIQEHIAEVNVQNQILEKEWNEISKILENTGLNQSKDRIKIRSKHFEQLLGYLEDAELATDQHNMRLFLERDTKKERPVGYEINHRNIFDPADDDINNEFENDNEYDEEKKESSCSVKDNEKSDNEANLCSSGNSASSTTSLSYEENSCDMSDESNTSMTHTRSYGDKSDLESDDLASQSSNHGGSVVDRIGNKTNSEFSPSQSIRNSSGDSNVSKDNIMSDDEKSTVCETIKSQCARPGCSMKPRYDSLFCCDACGICALEIDLMSSLEYASTMHPSLLRL